MSENKLHDAILAATKARRAVMSENINPESVRALLEGYATKGGPCDQMRGGWKLTAHEAALVDLKNASVRIARAYLALSERVGVLDAEVERWINSYKIAHNQAMANGQALAQARRDLAALSHKGMDQ